MKIRYQAQKGFRVKKGSVKFKDRRLNRFMGVVIDVGNKKWWCNSLDRWIEPEEADGRGYSTANYNVSNLKQLIRHVKKHKELEKGTKLRLRGRFKRTDITLAI